MEDFLQNNGFLLVTLTQQALLAISLYYPLMTGQLSVASPGFYAVGGYIAAIMGTIDFFAPWRAVLGWAIFPLEWLIAGLVSAVLAVLVGIPALRLRGIYLALATIAFVEILRVLCLNMEITGGAIGIFGVPQMFENRWSYIWVFGPLLIIMLLFTWRLEQTRVGRAFKAVREDEMAADCMGVNPTYFKVMAFVIGAVLAGVVGAMSAPFLNTWNARQGTFDASIAYLAYVLIGGSRSMWGPVMGAILLAALPEILRPLKDARLIINGLVLIIASIYLPQGIVGALQRLRIFMIRRVSSMSGGS
jgi:branched-chain amino acid transport system permease protein